MRSMLSVLGLTAALASPCLPPKSRLAPRLALNPSVTITSTTGQLDNWRGMVKKQSASAVETMWVNPSASPIYNGDYYEAYQSVGIDGASTNCNCILQAGTGQYIWNNGTEVTFWWYELYELYPADPVNFYDIISNGNSVHVKVEASSPTQGTVYLSNLSNGYNRQTPLISYQGGLCFETVEWIQEASLGTTRLPSFSTFDITNCVA